MLSFTLIVLAYVSLMFFGVIGQNYQVVYYLVGITIAICAAFIAYTAKSRRVKRKPFSEDTKLRVDRKQGGRCNSCGVIPRHPKFDHIHSRGDDSIQNCQMLCGDCHDDKTNAERKKRDPRARD